MHAATARGGPGAARTAESVRRSLESTILMKQLLEMGFPPNWCAKALAANRNNVDAALTWILSNGETLAAEDHEEEENAASVSFVRGEPERERERGRRERERRDRLFRDRRALKRERRERENDAILSFVTGEP